MSAPQSVTDANSPRSQASREQALLEINNTIATHLELSSLLKAVSGCLRLALPHDFAGLAIYDPEIQQLRVHGLDCEAAENKVSVAALDFLRGMGTGHLAYGISGWIFTLQSYAAHVWKGMS